MSGQGSTGNVIAAVASFFIPGLGQLVQGKIFFAVFFFVVCSLGYFFWWLVFPGVIAVVAHLWAIVDAALYKGS
ncbi:hypothetical protein SOPP22_06020 [Shewanella sp. OPT22]|nr:hypothetical protein SOPP22_06020 [Shewanella sp. OPT22]